LVGPLYHRVQLLFLLGGAWMAAEMAAHFLKHPPVRLAKTCAVAVIALGGLLLAGSLLPAKLRGAIEHKVVSQAVAAASDSQFGADTAWIERRAKSWTDRFALHHPKTAWVYGLLVLGSAGLVFTASGRPGRVRLGQFTLVAATTLELGTLFATWTTFSPADDLRPAHPAIERVRELAGTSRVVQCSDSVAFARVFATPNLLSSYRIPTVDAYESIHYPSTSFLLRDEEPALLLTLAGAGVAVRPLDSPLAAGTAGWPVADTVSGYEIRKNPDALAPVLAGVEVGLPAKADALLPVLRHASAPVPLAATMNHWQVELPQGTRWLRLAQNWHPGWRWQATDGNWHDTRRGPDGCIWVDLPEATRGTLELRFFPRSGYLEALSCAAWVTWLLAIAWRAGRRTDLPA